MNDRDLGQKLLRTGLPEADEARTKIKAVLDRDARRFRWLVRGVWALWLATALKLAFVYWAVAYFFWPRERALLAQMGLPGAMSVFGLSGDEIGRTGALLPVIVVSWGVPFLIVALGALMASLLATNLLVHSARRNTLRHVNANLAEMSEQLRQLRALMEKPPAG